MAKVYRSPSAENDLAEILGDLDEKNPTAAERFAAEFDLRARTLAQFH